MGDALGNAGMKFCFLAERQVGIGSAAAALEPYVKQTPNITWTDVTYAETGGFIERLPLPGRLGGTLRGYQQTSETLRRGPYDALLFLTHNPAVFQQQALRRTPALLWTDVTPALLDQQAEQYDHPVDRLPALSKLKHSLVRRTFRSAALCVGWSEWARRSFVADYGVPERNTTVVAPGIDLAHWRLPQRVPSQGLPRLLFVGGNFRRKGGDVLLALFRDHLRGRCELDLVTRDPVDAEPGVRVHRGLSAKSPELLALYRDAAAFVLPTRGDCFSIASLEAMAMGLPVVVSQVGGIADIVEHGRSGYLMDPNDARGLRDALEQLLKSAEHCRALGARGRQLVEQRFDARLTAERLLDLMRGAARALKTP